MIWDKAQELGRMIGQTPEYQALRRAETNLREDRDTVAKLDQIQRLARQVDQLIAQGAHRARGRECRRRDGDRARAHARAGLQG